MDPGSAVIAWFFAIGCFLSAALFPLVGVEEDSGLASVVMAGVFVLLGAVFVWLGIIGAG